MTTDGSVTGTSWDISVASMTKSRRQMRTMRTGKAGRELRGA
jgi:hypothetical protein